MPETEVRAYRAADNSVPLLEWLGELETREPKAYAKCLAVILELASKGNELRRPIADYLRDGIYELRTRKGRVNYRILYFYFGKHMACLSHGITKEDEVPAEEIELAIQRKQQVISNPSRFTADFEV